MKTLMTLFLFGSLLSGSAAVAAPMWGEPKADHCVNIHERQYSSILWNLPWGTDWDKACYATPLPFAGNTYRARRCSWNAFQEWGEFDVPDASCMAYWGPLHDLGCRAQGKRYYVSYLQNLPQFLPALLCQEIPKLEGMGESLYLCNQSRDVPIGIYIYDEPGCLAPAEGVLPWE